MMNMIEKEAREALIRAAALSHISLEGMKVRRTSSRFCLGVEHGDYNGTELFGVGTDRFLWLAYRPSGNGRIRLFSANFPDDGVVDCPLDAIPGPMSVPDSWARFPLGAVWVLQQEGFILNQGVDAVLYGNIPGGGMSRSASLALNLILTFAEVNDLHLEKGMRVVDLAQKLENDYIGSPCGKLDPIMIYFARAGMGTHFRPMDQSIRHVPCGADPEGFRMVTMDTGTVRKGLEKSTYTVRHAECRRLLERLRAPLSISCLADIRTVQQVEAALRSLGKEDADLGRRLHYLFFAQQRFRRMLQAWEQGDMVTIGKIFRADGIGLRDQYCISGPELETMCDIARSVPDVLGERMLGGGDKGASGALIRTNAMDSLRKAVDLAFPRSWPDLADRYALHVCRSVDGVKLFDTCDSVSGHTEA